LVAGAAAALAGCAGLLAASDVTGQLLAGVLAVVLLLRARLYGGAAQRAALLCAGSAAALAAALGALAAAGVSPIVALGVPAAVLAVGALATSARLPGARLAPPWGRAADLLEGALVVAVLPLVLAVLGAYGAMRDLTS
ncbi:MAG: hypothetical protein LBQ06_00900, partial [Frankiaceae bacterium]|nr:hypothetical protein [Frankiaceae bacterium]